MTRNILTAALHNARSARELQQRHETFLAKRKRQRGEDVVPHVVKDPVAAFINHGRWVLLCTCRAGVLAHPGWNVGRCFGCGAVYTDVVFPVDRAAIEQALVARGEQSTRNWVPTETLEDLLAENDAHGVKGATV